MIRAVSASCLRPVPARTMSTCCVLYSISEMLLSLIGTNVYTCIVWNPRNAAAPMLDAAGYYAARTGGAGVGCEQHSTA